MLQLIDRFKLTAKPKMSKNERKSFADPVNPGNNTFRHIQFDSFRLLNG